MDLPHSFGIGLFLWVAATVLAVRMFWIFPYWVPHRSKLEKGLIAFIGVCGFIAAAANPVTSAYRKSHTGDQSSKRAPPDVGPTDPNRVRIIPPQDGWFASYGMTSTSDNTFRVALRTAPLSAVQQDFDIIIAVRVDDHAVDEMSDHSIEKSEPFSILLPTITIDTVLGNEFIQRIFPNTNREGTSQATLKSYLTLVPRGTRAEEVLTLSDLRHLNGYILGSAAMTVSISRKILRERTSKPPAVRLVVPSILYTQASYSELASRSYLEKGMDFCGY